MFGYRAEEIIGKPITLLLPPELTSEEDLILQRLQRNEFITHYETVRLAKDGRRIDVSLTVSPLKDTRGNVIGGSKILRDITERKKAEERLRSSLRRIELLAATASELLISREPQKVVESLCRRVMEHLDCHAFFNYLVDQGAGRLHLNACAGIPEEEARRIEWLDYGAAVCGCVARDGCRIITENILATSDPRTELVKGYGIRAYACHPLLGPDGEVMGTLSFGTRSRETFSDQDLSLMKAVADHVAVAMARVRIEKSLRQAQAAAEAASKAKDHFLAVLSHELRNPLNPVLATASMLRDDPRFDADTREQLEVICRNAELEARLIDDLLDVTRIERGKVDLDRRPVDLCAILRQAVEVCLSDIETRKLHFIVDAPDGPYWIDADPARLQQVFWNLLKNAIKFTPQGGCVGVRCRPDGQGHIVVEVTDSGEGIEPEALDRIFNAFDQAERSITRQFGGLGLGLTISKALVEMHGGGIRAASPGKGKGATFTVRLPLLAGKVAAPATPPTPSTPPAAPIHPLRILLVEDHGDTARIMCRLLSAEGHEVQAAADVASALSLAEKQAFDLLLSDLGLPDGSGLDLMRSLRARGLTLPAIALSGYGQEQDAEQSRQAGFRSHLTKPVSLPKLKQAIAKVSKSRD